MPEPLVTRELLDVNEGVDFRLRRKRRKFEKSDSAGSERQEGRAM
jgi:hypothetical protein